MAWGRLPHHKFNLRLSIRRYISNTTSYISNATGGTLSDLSYGSTLWTRADGGGSPSPTKNYIHALVSAGTQQEFVSKNAFPLLAYGDTLQTRVGGGGYPPTKNFICALVPGGTFQTRPGTF